MGFVAHSESPPVQDLALEWHGRRGPAFSYVLVVLWREAYGGERCRGRGDDKRRITHAFSYWLGRSRALLWPEPPTPHTPGTNRIKTSRAPLDPAPISKQRTYELLHPIAAMSMSARRSRCTLPGTRILRLDRRCHVLELNAELEGDLLRRRRYART